MKKKSFWPLTTCAWGQWEVSVATRVLKSRNVTQGNEVLNYEREFAEHVGARYAVAVNSGSSANLLAVASLMQLSGRDCLCPGDEVLVPAIAWSTTYAPLAQLGLKLRVVDVEPQTLGMCPACVKLAITKHTRMLVAVNILGFPAHLTELRAFAKQHGLIFFEDNCESFGARYENKFCGTHGDVGTFSTFFSHHLNTIEGGMVVTNDVRINLIARSLRAHGLQDGRVRPDAKIEDQYNFVLPGFNLRTTDVQAAIGRVQLQRAGVLERARLGNWSVFRDLFPNGDARSQSLIRQDEIESAGAVPYGFVLIMPPAARSKLSQQLRKAGIEHRPVTGGCFTRHPYSTRVPHSVCGDLSVANLVHDGGLFVGNHPTDLRRQIIKLRSIVTECL